MIQIIDKYNQPLRDWQEYNILKIFEREMKEADGLKTHIKNDIM